MKIEIEITEEEMRSVVQNRVSQSIIENSQGYQFNEIVSELVRNALQKEVRFLISQMVENSEDIKKRVTSEIESRIRKHVISIMK